MVILYYGNGERSGVGHMEILWNDANISPPPRISLHSHGCPRSHCVNESGLKLIYKCWIKDVHYHKQTHFFKNMCKTFIKIISLISK